MKGSNRKIKKILVANRGEIAIRIIKTARLMGIETVTLYTEEEKDLPHRFLSDQAYSLGEGPLSETYLNQEKILEIAQLSGANAIHPGYGFLSERANFARKVKERGLIFIGPSPESIELMGDKKTSKIKIEELGVPSIPGYHGNKQDLETLKLEAEKIGYPVLIKASAGGGGKGMRIVYSASEFARELEGAKREALKAFSDDTVLLEKYITSPRHIEIQVMSDRHGNHLHLYERECSIQRRYQKIVEESPSVALTPSLRQKMVDAALKVTRGISYEGAGTIELILDTDGRFYFLEMNTRLQVEHPVTEMVTGLDLVRMQIEVAEGLPLRYKQEDILQRGHAIEVRLYAEDPDNHFLPSVGKIKKIGTPEGLNVRLDVGFVEGNEVGISFDPMLAKLVAYGESRVVARDNLLSALDNVLFLGLTTNRDYLKRILASEEFLSGLTFTHFVKTYSDKLQKRPFADESLAEAIAAFLLTEEPSKTEKKSGADIWERLQSFRN